MNPITAFALIREGLRRSGGIKPALLKCWTLYREGLAGGGGRLALLQRQSVDYVEWISRYQTLTHEARTLMSGRAHTFPYKPIISVVMPTYNTRPEWLAQAIESVQNQLYPNWELCIADDASSDPHVRPLLEQYATKDNRIKLVFRKDHGHISAASNSALKLATGDFIAFLDHDDLLAEHALFWVVDSLALKPDAQLIFSDEDKIDTAGKRFQPYFKSEWNEDLFYSHNMICHLAVYRSKLVHELGGLREGFEGAQDYDLALRCIERIHPAQIVHIPRILYHWRMHVGSTASGGLEKPYALGAGAKAINEHLCRQGMRAIVEPLNDLRMYRVRYPLPKSQPLVSLILPIRNGIGSIRRFLSSMNRKTTYGNYEILILDNGSDDPTVLEYLHSLNTDPRIRIIRDNRPFSLSALNNATVRQASGEVIGMVNNEAEVISAEWLSEMVSHALRPGVGAVGARLLYPNETVRHAGVILGIHGVAGLAHRGLSRYLGGYFNRAVLIQSLSAVTADCLVIRKEVYLRVGGFTEELKTVYNDIDFCLKVREAGYRNIYTPYAELYYHGSTSKDCEDRMENELMFEREESYIKKRWGELLLNDPAYNPNLTLEREDFALAWPPRIDLLASVSTKN